MTSVFRKLAHTDQYVHFHYRDPQPHKQSVVRTLLSIAESFSSCPLLKFTEELHISKAFQDDSYPNESSRLSRPHPSSPTEMERPTTLTLKELSAAIQRVLVHLEHFQTNKNSEEFVHKIPCSECSKCCIGQTGRTLTKCLKEHQRPVFTFDVNTSALAEHVISTNKWDNTTIINRYTFTHPHCTMESWHIGRCSE